MKVKPLTDTCLLFNLGVIRFTDIYRELILVIANSKESEFFVLLIVV